jgi:hypothetical protein
MATANASELPESPEPREDVPLCPHCLKGINRFDHFCPHCGGPVTAHASVDPFGQVFSAGRAYQRAATSSRPRLIVVLGVWLIFAPQLVILLVGVVQIVLDMVGVPPMFSRLLQAGGVAPDQENPLLQGAAVAIMLGLAVIYGVILWKVTHHCFVSRPPGYCPKCRYDLRGSIPAGRRTCPECGEPIPADMLKEEPNPM